jgi:hypothetical protein
MSFMDLDFNLLAGHGKWNEDHHPFIVATEGLATVGHAGKFDGRAIT